MGCEAISGIATGIWSQLNEPTSLSVSFIYNKLLSSGFIGTVNTLTATCNYIESGCVYPPLDSSQLAIYQSLYLYQYYAAEGPRAMASFAAKNYVTNVREGDSAVSFASPQQLLVAYRGLAQEYKKEVDSLSDYYKRNLAGPRAVDALNIEFPNTYPIQFTSNREVE